MNEIARNEGRTSTLQRPGNGTVDGYVSPRSTVYQSPDAVILELEMPGVTKDGLEITVENDELTITGRRNRPADEGFEIVHQERLLAPYHRTYILSERIDTANIGAGFENGVLRMTLPKSAEAKPRKIQID